MQDLVTDWDRVPIMVPLEHSARVIGISRSSLYNLIKSGDLRVRRVGGRVFVTKAELQRFVGDRAA